MKLLFAYASNGESFDLKVFSDALIQNQEFDASRIYMLSLISAHESQPTQVFSYLIDQCEKIAFNDKNKEAFIQQVYFEPFYKALTEQSLKESVLPLVNFVMNRSGLLIPNITYLTKNVSFKLSNELASALTVAILTKDYLITFNNEILELIKEISEKLSTPEEFSKSLMSYLIG